ncbi:MAG: transglutaminase family protein [Myxococcales bacterium]|nr:transglutaminase family protein [Myxococcales bacterium]
MWSSEPDGGVLGAESRQATFVPASGSQTEAGQQPAAAQPVPVTATSQRVGSDAIPRTLQVVHETAYTYDQPVERSSHRLLLRPVEDRYQEIVDYGFAISPPVASTEFEDVFGNTAMAFELAAPYTALQITSRMTVHLRGARSLEHRAAHRRHAIPLTWMPWQRQMLSTYLLPPELPETQLQELSEFAMSFVERNDYDLIGTLLDLNETIYADFEYATGSTTIATTAFEVFESRRGVCQDFANLMICVARLLQIPARYRMGYIFTGADYANKIQSEASHAWVELYLPQVGWHGLDPTNGIQVGTNHVRVACGRNYRDATPTSGTIYRGGGTETLTTSVRVAEV